MVQSMTGFATCALTITTPNGAPLHVTMTIKTLNNRFLDVSCKFPYALSYLETEAIRLCKAALHRGSVYATIHVSNPQALQSNIIASLDIASSYMDAISALQKKLAIPGTPTIADIIALPHVFESAEQINLEESKTQLLAGLESLLKTLVSARELEGAALQHDLEGRMKAIAKHMAAIEPRSEEVNVERQAYFVAELKKALEHAQANANETQLQALYSSFVKIDVHEEIVRFKNHVENFLTTLQDANVQKGKKLDFILQELFREINTLSAKLTDAQASNHIIAIKVELEKAREQAQNLV